MSVINALEIKGLKKTYKNGFCALKGIDLTIKEGDFFALLGPNGAGKSTTIGIITSLIMKSAGTVRILGHDLDTETAEAKRLMGVVPQEINLNIFETPLQILINQASYYGILPRIALPRAQALLKQMDLWEKRGVQARMLSGGMKRRLMIARALIHQPKFLILDEPTAGVDVEIRQSMWALLKDLNAKGTTILLTTHYLEEAENLCRHIAIINKGEIIKLSAMRALLSELETETLVLYLTHPIEKAPVLVDFASRLIDEKTLEVDVNKQQNLNSLFMALNAAHIEVQSLRNKSNRLERLFINLVGSENASA